MAKMAGEEVRQPTKASEWKAFMFEPEEQEDEDGEEAAIEASNCSTPVPQHGTLGHDAVEASEVAKAAAHEAAGQVSAPSMAKRKVCKHVTFEEDDVPMVATDAVTMYGIRHFEAKAKYLQATAAKLLQAECAVEKPSEEKPPLATTMAPGTSASPMPTAAELRAPGTGARPPIAMQIAPGTVAKPPAAVKMALGTGAMEKLSEASMVAKVAPVEQQKEIVGDAERVAEVEGKVAAAQAAAVAAERAEAPPEPLSRYAAQLMEQLANPFPGMEVAIGRGSDGRLRSCGSGR